jgi:quercetin dioxygenase-like cupin family protein
MANEPFRDHKGGYRWAGVDVHAYKAEGSAPFRDITRQTLFREDGLAGELRYFEIAPGGHSTLERHEHVHAVMILRGGGRCLVGDTVRTVSPLDLVSIAPMTWHQFRADSGEPLGFLCLVDARRDKPQLPSAEDLARMTADPDVAAFIRPA